MVVEGDTQQWSGGVEDDGSLVFDQASDATFGSVINGNGAVTQAGSGTLTLTADNDYTGTTDDR